ncbi:MAG TPA: MaoC/PaaZ C-terminal domain-containing protein [Cellulomonas sp.]
MTTQVVLPAVPALGGLYARGLAAGMRLAAVRRAGTAPTGLPDAEYDVGDVPVDPVRLAAYQSLLGLRAADRLPAGFVHTMAFPLQVALMVRPDFPLQATGMIHVANRVTQRHPLWRDDRLHLRVRAVDLRPHRAGTQLDFVSEARRAGSADVAWEGVSTYLAKGVHLAGEAQPDDEHADFVPPTPTGSWQLPADTGRRYAAVSGDRNPVHLTALTARPFGFPRAIAHGMYTAARALAAVGPAAGHTFVWTADFTKPLLLPATVAVRVAPDGDVYRYAVWKPGPGRPYLTGTVRPLP